jgi:hypothetical protein
MTRVILDEAMKKKLYDLQQPLEICDTTGKVLGRFTPADEPPTNRPREPQLSEEELVRREQEPDFSTEEVLAYLEKL